MSSFENVTIELAANLYFDGKVTSRSIHLPDGTKKTLGIMLPGEYEFGTDTKELMEITQGELEVKLPGEEAWQSITAGGRFHVPANASFQLKVHSVTDYCCSYG